MAEKIVLEISATGNGEVQLKKISDAAKDLGNQGSKSLLNFQRTLDNFAANLASEAVLGAFNSLRQAAGAVFDFFVTDGIKAAQQQEDALKRLEVALGANGNAAEGALDRFDAFASQIQATTKFEDDAVISTAALIESLTGLSEEGLQKATQAAIDMSAALGVDLDTAAQAISKSVELGTQSLKKYGIEVQKGATESQTLANVLEAVNEKFGGAAAAQVNTYSGAIALTENAFGELGEAVGSAIITNQSLVNVIKTAGEIFVSLTKDIQNNKGVIQSFITEGLILMIDTTRLAIDAVGGLQISFLTLERALLQVAATTTGVLNTLTFGLSPIGHLAEAAAEGVKALDSQIASLQAGDGILAQVGARLDQLQASAQNGLGAIATAGDNAQRSLTAAATATDELTAAQQRLAEEGQKIYEQTLAQDPQALYAQRLEALIAYAEQAKLTEEQLSVSLIQLEEERTAKYGELDLKRLEHEKGANQEAFLSGQISNQQKLIADNERIKATLDSEKLSEQQKQSLRVQALQNEKQINQERLQSGMQAVSALASFQNSKVKEVAALGKAAAIAQATMNTYQAATGALAALSPIPIVGPVLAIAAAAAIIAAGLANVAQISGANLQTGLSEVPPGFPNDSFRANLSSGERVVDADTNKDLKMFLANSDGTNALLAALVDRVERLESRTVVNIGGREIVNEVQRQIDSGRALNV